MDDTVIIDESAKEIAKDLQKVLSYANLKIEVHDRGAVDLDKGKVIQNLEVYWLQNGDRVGSAYLTWQHDQLEFGSVRIPEDRPDIWAAAIQRLAPWSRKNGIKTWRGHGMPDTPQRSKFLSSGF